MMYARRSLIRSIIDLQTLVVLLIVIAVSIGVCSMKHVCNEVAAENEAGSSAQDPALRLVDIVLVVDISTSMWPLLPDLASAVGREIRSNPANMRVSLITFPHLFSRAPFYFDGPCYGRTSTDASFIEHALLVRAYSSKMDDEQPDRALSTVLDRGNPLWLPWRNGAEQRVLMFTDDEAIGDDWTPDVAEGGRCGQTLLPDWIYCRPEMTVDPITVRFRSSNDRTDEPTLKLMVRHAFAMALRP